VARKPLFPTLTVSMNGRTVGCLLKNSTGQLCFRVAGQWLNWQYAFATSNSLSPGEDRYAGAAVRGLFDHLVPQGDHLRPRLVATSAVTGVDAMAVIRSQMPLAIKPVVDKLPARFPEKLRFSVMNGIQQRLRLLNAVVQ